jgi:hypothetical protein
MITLNIQTTFGTIQVNGETEADLNRQVAQLEKAGDLMAAVGRLSTLADGANVEANVGKVLGGEVIEETPHTPEPEEVTTSEAEDLMLSQPPIILGKTAKKWEGRDSQGDERVAWIDPRDNLTPDMVVTDNPDDPRLAAGTARFWLYLPY